MGSGLGKTGTDAVTGLADTAKAPFAGSAPEPGQQNLEDVGVKAEAQKKVEDVGEEAEPQKKVEDVGEEAEAQKRKPKKIEIRSKSKEPSMSLLKVEKMFRSKNSRSVWEAWQNGE